MLRRATVAHICAISQAQSGVSANGRSVDWATYGGQAAGDHFSSLTQISRQNVKDLRLAWKFDGEEEGGLETSPIIVGGILYGYTATQKVIALDGATGKLIWKFDSQVNSKSVRGLAYWTDGKRGRILASVTNFLYALDCQTGQPIPEFGENGRIDLRKGLRGDYRLLSLALTSPGIVYKDLIIVGGRNPETHPSPPGDIRAFDVLTGALRWTFHTIPRPGEYGYETWPKDAWTAPARPTIGRAWRSTTSGASYCPNRLTVTLTFTELTGSATIFLPIH